MSVVDRRPRRLPRPGRVVSYALVAVVMLFYLFPLVYLLNTALKTTSGFYADPNGIVTDPHFSNFVGTYLGDRQSRIVEAVARAAEGLDWSPLEVALTWVRDRPGVTAPIVGARTAAQLRGSLTVEELELPPQIVAALDDVSGCPDGE